MAEFKQAKNFYQQLGASGLEALMNEKQTKGYVSFLKKNLRKQWHILDVACGYGRLTIPLAQAGYTIEGLDLSSKLITEARKQAKKFTLEIPFEIGNMIQLPYENNIFDAIICNWSSFNELLRVEDQMEAIREMIRVAKRGGIIIIDLPVMKIAREKGRVTMAYISGLKHSFFAHDKGSLEALF